MRGKSPPSVLSAVLAAALLATGHAEAANTSCLFGSPTPGYDAIRLDLPNGSSFLTLSLTSTRQDRGINTSENWHFVAGIFVVNADTLALEAFRIASRGMSPRTVVVAPEGDPAVVQPVAGPEIAYSHSGSGVRAGLGPGSYYVIAFGTDGGPSTPNEYWKAGVDVEGPHGCNRVGRAGTLFDFNHTDFSGGTQVYVPGAGYADEIALSFETPRQLVVGVMDVETQASAVSNVLLEYETPTSSGMLSQQLVPFVSTGGAYWLEASYIGYQPLVLIAGVALDVAAP